MAKDIGKRLAQTALNQRSDGYQWLRKNHDQIAAVFALQARPSWTALAKTAAESDIPCTPDTLRKAWLRLERDLARAIKKPSRPIHPTPSTVPPQKLVSPSDQRPSPTPYVTADDDEFEFRTLAGPTKKS